MSTKPATGTITMIDGAANLVLQRQFVASVEDVWASMTAPSRLSQWIGHWEGDPASGQVDFFMTAEAADATASPYTIVECDKPRRFAGDTSVGTDSWHLWFELAEADGVTTLTFGQRFDGGEDIGSIGPGWEYYLDRLVAARAGEPVEAIDFNDYYPSQSEHYTALAP